MSMGDGFNPPLLSNASRRHRNRLEAAGEIEEPKPPKVTYVGEVPLYEGDDLDHASWRRQMQQELWGTP